MNKVNPLLAEWLNEQMRLGCSFDTMKVEMLRSGYDASFAQSVLEKTFQLHATVHQVQGQTETLFHRGSPRGNAIHLDGHTVDILFAMQSPRIVLFSNVLTHAECDELQALATSRMKRAEVVDPQTGAYSIDPARTSDGASFHRGETTFISGIEERIERLIGWPASHGEGLQVLHYRPGGEYQPHFDYFPPNESGSAAQLKHGGQRIATLVIYLNDCPVGGSTVFPTLGVEIMPKKGNAVYFAYTGLDGSLDERSLHAGAPVIAGDKWIATKWLRENAYI